MMRPSQSPQWRLHAFLVLLVILFSFVLNQAPFVFSHNPYSIGNDGDSGIHVAIQMKLRNPALFPKDIELNEMYLFSRPAFEPLIHRIVIWVADYLFDGNLFHANIASFWIYHILFIIGCYLLGWNVYRLASVATLFAAASVGLSLAFVAWWGMVYAAVIPHDLGLCAVPWFILGYLRLSGNPRGLLLLFFALGLTVNVYPLQPVFLGVIFFVCSLIRGHHSLSRMVLIGLAFVLGALPSLLTSAIKTFEQMTMVNPLDKPIVDSLFVQHYGYLLLSPIRTAVKLVLASPVWLFMVLSGIAFFLKRRNGELHETDRQVITLKVVTLFVGLSGFVLGAVFRPLITFLPHRASSFLYIPAYLGCSWLVAYLIRRRRPFELIVAFGLAVLILFNGTRHTALFSYLRNLHYLQTSRPYYELAEWASKKTPVDSLFMVPFGQTKSYYAFRAYAGRGVLLHWATGESVLSNPMTAPLFWRISKDLEPLYQNGSTTREFVRIAKKYHVDYIITDRTTPHPPDLTIAYRNEVFTAFVVPQLGP